MKNSIWVGKNKHGNYYWFSGKRPTINGDELIGEWYSGVWIAGFFNLDLKPLEIVELIYDTETGKIEVKREREIGWYLTVWSLQDTRAVARYWNGSVFHANRRSFTCEAMPESEITVLYKLPDNEYLKGLE